MNAVNRITIAGIERADDIVDIAREAGLSLPVAVTLVQKESNGRNVWGSDRVDTGGTYVKGSVVTREAYERYRAKRRSGDIGMQGVGPCQLTWFEFQDRADELGGCWDYLTNLRVGFGILADLQRQYGTREGFRRYNGSGPAAERYANDAMSKLASWTKLIGSTPSPKVMSPKTLSLSSEGPEVLQLQKYLNRVFPSYSKLVTDGRFGEKTEAVIREFQRRSGIDDDGVVGPVTWGKLGY